MDSVYRLQNVWFDDWGVKHYEWLRKSDGNQWTTTYDWFWNGVSLGE